jgi:hypothetical protein
LRAEFAFAIEQDAGAFKRRLVRLLVGHEGTGYEVIGTAPGTHLFGMSIGSYTAI